VSQALARKWRPKTFAELVGQEHVVKALTNGADAATAASCLSVHRTRGSAKTTLRAHHRQALNCETGITATPCGKCTLHRNRCRPVRRLIELDAASNTQVDNMRRPARERALCADQRAFQGVHHRRSAHVVAHAFNAMLKTL